MKAALQVKTLALGAMLLCTALGCAGLTLGRAQGVIFVGRPLDLRVQLQTDGGEDTQAGCLEADVSYGDTLLDPARVHVTVESAAGRASGGASVRVLSSVLVDEPVVTVNLRTVCQQKSSKRYTLFADVASNVVEPATRAPAPPVTEAARAPATVSAPASAPAPAPATASAAAPVTGPAHAVAEKPHAARQPPAVAEPAAPRPRSPAPSKARTDTAERAAAPVAWPRPSRAPRVAGKSRLQLDSLDLLIERDPLLQASPELLTVPQEDAQKRAEAAALWRALNASPEELMRDEVKAQRIEKDLKSLYAVTAENQKGLVALVAKVQRAQSERYANGLVYTLVAVWLLSLLALFWVWRRLRAARAPSWLHGLEAGDSLLAELAQAPPVNPTAATPEAAPVPASAAVAAAAAASPVAPAAPLVPLVPLVPFVPVSAARPTATAAAPAREPAPPIKVDFDLDLMAPPLHLSPLPALRAVRAVPEPAQHARAPAAGRQPVSAMPPGVHDFSVSMASGLRAIDSEELLDVRQQADFFVSLGEHQKAIDILTTRIAQCGESSPLVCLDLLKIFHALGRRAEFAFMRTEFNNWFTGHVPEFQAFGDEGNGLDCYPKVMERIVALWPDSRVLEYIENCLYHHSSDADEPHFDLRAYRELLLLHGVAKRIVRMEDDAADSHLSELMRIPARAPAVPGGDTAGDAGSGDPAHRPGPQHRGVWKRSPLELPDPQAELVTRGAPLWGMKLPPAPPGPEAPDSQSPPSDPDTEPGGLTDFNFLNLR